MFNLDDYETVDSRLKKYLKLYPDARVITKMHSNENGTVVFKAAIYEDGKALSANLPKSTGWAEETKGEGGMANKNAHVENCETSAIGRALANAGYSGDKRASREEMIKVQ